VTIETAATPTDGEPNPSYTTLAANVPAEVIETGGGEYLRGRQIEAGVNAVVTIRYRDDITPRMRVKYGARYLNIESAIDPTGYRSELQLTCKEIQP
jgi:SPP1 family predicted phage head-tail adaptor